jgi:hypothetical protein
MGNCRNISTIIRSSSQKPYKNLKYRINKTGYAQYNFIKYDENGIKTRKTILIHRLVAIHFIPNLENKFNVDHINNNKSDNSIFNLRWVTISENSRNRNSRKNATSKYIGVCYDKDSKKWMSYVNVNGKNHIKRFDNEKEAAIKRDEYILDNELEYFKLNFVHI